MALPLAAFRLFDNKEIAVRLSKVARSRGPGRVPVAILCKHLGISRPTYYAIAKGGRVAERSRPVFSIVLGSLEHRTLLFERRRNRWQTIRRSPPVPLPPPQDKMMRADEWNEWARCRTCAALSWIPALRGGRPHWVCGRCIPHDQFPYLGLEVTRSAKE